MKKSNIVKSLSEKYPPSAPCSCNICVSYCERPGWWTVEEASKVIAAGLSKRMMMEISPEKDFAVLSPAFKGNEANIALQAFSRQGCTFLKNNLCELFGRSIQPLECRFCHHNRKGLGIKCHTDIEKDWNTEKGKALVKNWATEIFNRETLETMKSYFSFLL